MFEFIKDFFAFMFARKKYWLIPILILFLIFGLLIVFAGSTPVGPFIYPMF